MKASRARKCRLELFGKVPGASTAAGASFSCSHTDGRRGAVPLWPMTARNSSALRQRRRAARSRSWWGSRDAHAIAARSLVTLRGTPGLQLIEHYRTHVRRGGPNQELQLRTRLILYDLISCGQPKTGEVSALSAAKSSSKSTTCDWKSLFDLHFEADVFLHKKQVDAQLGPDT